METFLWLFLLSLTMFIGSFLAGSIPLAFHLSEDRLRTISAFGVGLLVGTSLIVIIPEGIETLYSVSGSINLNSSPITPTIKDNILEQRNMWNNVELQRKGPNNYDDN